MKKYGLRISGMIAVWGLVLIFACAKARQPSPELESLKSSNNLILFVADGLRHSAVTAERAPTFFQISQQGVSFPNSHSIYPTLTMANASTLSTGHLLADTGIFANSLFVNFPVTAAHNSPIPFLEDDAVLNEVDNHFDQNVLDGQTVLQAAYQAGYSAAAIGKLGPATLQLLPERKSLDVTIVDDQTGTASGIELAPAVKSALTAAGLPLVTPGRGDNGKGGNFQTPGTLLANLVQQQYFLDVATKVVLPSLKQKGKPFVLVFWSRDPDGTQHNQGDSLNQLTPGITGPTSLRAIRNADDDLKAIRQTLETLGLTDSTNIVVTSDHGFSTISRQSQHSFAASKTYPDTVPGFLPTGFLAIDLANALKLQITDPDNNFAPVDPNQGQHSTNATLGNAANPKQIMIAANGGSDLLYLLGDLHSTAGATRVVNALLAQDYSSGIFVADELGSIPGTLPFSAIGLMGHSSTPRPSIFVSFKSFGLGCLDPTWCGAVVADTVLQQGQGNHGSFGRQDTFNFTAAVGPDFKSRWVDHAPVSNADVGVTLAHLLGLTLNNGGTLSGRVLNEILAENTADAPDAAHKVLVSKPGLNGLTTVLKYQELGNYRYYDAAGFPGRTIGLENIH